MPYRPRAPRKSRRHRPPVHALPWDRLHACTAARGVARPRAGLAARRADRDGFAARRAESEAVGLLRGQGLCYYIESILGDPSEGARVTFDEDGGVSLFVGTQSNGQGHATAYAQFIVRTEDLDAIPALDQRFYRELNEAFPSAQVRTQRLQFGPGDGAGIEARFQGPSPEVLRSLADQAQRIMADSPYLIDQRTDWRQQELVVRPRINEERARIAGVSREDITQTLQFASSGIRAGTYREGEHLLPIVARPPAAERDDVALLENRNVWSAAQQRFVPISQVVSSFDTDSEEALIQRRNRVRTLTVGADPAEGYTAAQAFGGIREEIEAMTLPPGYQLSWGGEHEDSGDAQEALAQQLPISLLVMLLTSI